MLPPLEPDSAKEYWISQLRSHPNTQLGMLYDMKVGYDPKKGSIIQQKDKENVLATMAVMGGVKTMSDDKGIYRTVRIPMQKKYFF